MGRLERKRKRLVRKRDRLLDGHRNELVEVEPGRFVALEACTTEQRQASVAIGRECEQLLSRIDKAIETAVEGAGPGVSTLGDLGLTPDLIARIASDDKSVVELRSLADDVEKALVV